jgi:hypothetical protein
VIAGQGLRVINDRVRALCRHPGIVQDLAQHGHDLLHQAQLAAARQRGAAFIRLQQRHKVGAQRGVSQSVARHKGLKVGAGGQRYTVAGGL